MIKKLLSASLICIFTFSQGANAEEKRGTLEKVVNFVQVDDGSTRTQDFSTWVSTQKRWKRVSEGQPLYIGNVLRTGPRSVAEIRYDDGNLTRIGSRTNIIIKDRELKLKRGFIWGKVNKLLSKGLKIYAANAVASIVGTEFFVEVSKDNSTMVTVLEGTIDVAGKDGHVLVTEGTYAIIDKDGKANDPVAFNKDEVIARYSEVVYMK
jgi:hypothetical protein